MGERVTGMQESEKEEKRDREREREKEGKRERERERWGEGGWMDGSFPKADRQCFEDRLFAFERSEEESEAVFRCRCFYASSCGCMNQKRMSE